MNESLLIQKRINFPIQYINFLNFIHPHFELVTNIDEYDNPSPNGLIYYGQCGDDLVNNLNRITNKWIIVNMHHYDVDLSTNDGLIKNLLPLHYIKLKNDKKSNGLTPYLSIPYETLLDNIKISLINNSQLSYDDSQEQSVYSLFTAILATPDILASVYFNLVNKKNINLIISSMLTFLNRVQSNNTSGASTYYIRLITQSNKRYGKFIKSAISRFVKSSYNKEIAFYNLLTDLNKAR